MHSFTFINFDERNAISNINDTSFKYVILYCFTGHLIANCAENVMVPNFKASVSRREFESVVLAGGKP